MSTHVLVWPRHRFDPFRRLRLFFRSVMLRLFCRPWDEPMITQFHMSGTPRMITRAQIEKELKEWLEGNGVPDADEFVLHGEPRVAPTRHIDTSIWSWGPQDRSLQSVVTVKISRKRR